MIAVGNRLIERKMFGTSNIVSLSHQLEDRWRSLQNHIEHRKLLLEHALEFFKNCDEFTKDYVIWINNVGVNPSVIPEGNHDFLTQALTEHNEFKQVFESAYSKAYSSATKLSKFMKKIFGASVGSFQSYKFLIERTQRIAHAERQLEGIWKSRQETIERKLSSLVFVSDMNSVGGFLNINK